MRRVALLTALVFVGFFGFHAHAFTLQNNAQCVGGTLIDSYTDVQDGGGLAVYTNAKMLAQADCAMLTPAGACCSVHVSTNGGGFGGALIPYTWFNYEIFSGGTVQGGYGPSQDAPCLANQPGCSSGKNSNYGRQHKYFAGPAAPAGGTETPPSAAVTASLVANPSSIESGESSLLTWSSTGAVSCTGNFTTGGATSGSVSVSPSATTEYVVTCTDSSTPVKTATARATVVVSDGTFQVSCRAHPTRAGVGEDVLWSSSVTGGEGSYTYEWSGSESLNSSGNQVFKRYTALGTKSARLKVTYIPSTPSAPSGPSASAPPPPSVPPVTIPRPTACPALGFVMPVSPCSGTWTPTYDTSGCQSGWQCTQQTGGGTTGGGLFDSIFENFQFLNFIPTFSVPHVLAATGSIVPHTEGELFTSAPLKADMLANGGVAFTETTFVGRTLAADQTTMNRVCVTLHGEGSTATQIGARGYGSCKNNGNIQYANGRWASVSGCTGAHLSGSFSCLVSVPPPSAGSCALTISPSSVVVGQSATLTWTSTGLSSLVIDRGIGSVSASGSRVITPTTSGAYTATGASSDTSTNFTIQSAHSSIISTMTQDTAKYGIAYNTSYGIYADPTTITHICEQVFGPGAVQQQYDVTAFNSCGNNQILKWDGSRWVAFGACQDNRKMLRVLDCKVPQVATAPSVQCTAATVTVTQPVTPTPEPQSKTVDCDNTVTVTVGTPECSDGLDNDRDGLADADDPQCLNGGGDGGAGGGGGGAYDPNGTSESGGRGDNSAECSDGRDNNGDGNVDYPDDLGCSSADDNLEFTEPSELTLTANPPLIKKNQQCTITLTAKNVATCTLTGTGVSRTFTPQNGYISTSEVITPALTQTTTYTLSCRGIDGKTATKKVDCKIAPTFEEI